MKFSINKDILLTTLQLISKATPIRSTLPIISSALFVVEKNILTIRATDLEISIKKECEVENSEKGSVAIPVSKLLEITNAMPNDMINFNISDIGKVKIDCNKGHYTIMGQSNEEFPTEHLLENSKILNLSGAELIDIINNTSYAASRDDLKPVLQGVLFQIENDGIISVATDGHRMVKVEKKNIHALEYSGSVVVPIKFLTLLNSLLKKEEKLSLFIANNHIQVKVDKIIITTRIIKEPYPDYDGVIPKDNTKTLVVNKNQFTEAIKRVSIFSNKSSRQIALELTDSKMIISTEDPENITTGKETIDCNYDGDPMTIGYNALYLKEVLQHQSSEEVKIMLNTPLNAGLFVPLEQNKNNIQTTLLMPIRLND